MSRFTRYLLLVVAVLLASLVGYRIFVAYPQHVLPSGEGIGLLALAAMAGAASLFSPCSFPLLMTFLSREAGDREDRMSTSFHLLRFSITFSLGAAAFLLFTGAALGLGAEPIMARITFTSPTGRLLRLLTGLALVGLGWLQWRRRSLSAGWLSILLQPLWRSEARLRRDSSTFPVVLYGFGYIFAGFG